MKNFTIQAQVIFGALYIRPDFVDRAIGISIEVRTSKTLHVALLRFISNRIYKKKRLTILQVAKCVKC